MNIGLEYLVRPPEVKSVQVLYPFKPPACCSISATIHPVVPELCVVKFVRGDVPPAATLTATCFEAAWPPSCAPIPLGFEVILVEYATPEAFANRKRAGLF